MGEHINDKGQFVSDKYPDLRPDFMQFSFRDENARAIMKWYAALIKDKDKELAEDILTRIRTIQEDDA